MRKFDEEVKKTVDDLFASHDTIVISSQAATSLPANKYRFNIIPVVKSTPNHSITVIPMQFYLVTKIKEDEQG